MKSTITIPVLGSYSETAPFSCAKIDKIITMTAEKLMKGTGDRPAIEELALMATGEKKYMEAAFKSIRSKDWAKGDGELISPGQYCTWYWGYRAIVLAEYYMLTKDESVMPALRDRSFKRARGLYEAMVKAVEGDTRPPKKLISMQEAIAAGK